MSVRAWKKVITFTVIAIILGLTISVIVISGNLQKAKAEQEIIEIKEDEGTLIDISEYGIDDITAYEKVLMYLGSATSEKAIKYQQKYPEMYVDNDFLCEESDGKNCYLTFDDGPNYQNTTTVLNTLKENDAHATFFVVYNDTEEAKELLRRMVDEGHTIGIHTASHQYTKIYSSVSAYLKDFYKVYNWVLETTGVAPEIFRFPGGSVNSYNIGTYREIISEMTRRGFTYYDWNCSSGDAASVSVDIDKIINNVVNKANYNQKIVLMHDGRGHANTVAALPSIISGLKKNGYKLEALTKEVQPVHFDYTID